MVGFVFTALLLFAIISAGISVGVRLADKSQKLVQKTAEKIRRNREERQAIKG